MFTYEGSLTTTLKIFIRFLLHCFMLMFKVQMQQRILSLESCECIPRCQDKNGSYHSNGDTWKEFQCLTCTCIEGRTSCENNCGNNSTYDFFFSMFLYIAFFCHKDPTKCFREIPSLPLI